MQQKTGKTHAPSARRYIAAEPLRHLAPVRDAKGASVADFMLLIPRLRERGPAFAEHAVQILARVCQQYGEQVCFADINLKTGAIWVSVQSRPGLCSEVARAIRLELPQALTVGGQLGAVQGGLVVFAGMRRRVLWLSRIRQHVVRRLLPSLPGSGSR